MNPIASSHNPRLKQLRRLQRRRERARTGWFTAEGEDLIAAARRARWPAVAGYRVAGSGLGGGDFVDVEPEALAEVSALGSGTRVIAVYAQRWLPAPVGPLCVYLHGVSDPGNVGTVLRAGLAFGASCVALGPGCADPFSPKAVRAGMGAIFAVPLARARALEDLPGERIALVSDCSPPAQPLERLRDQVRGQPVAGLEGRMGCARDSRAGRPSVDPSESLLGSLTLLVGSERDGLPEALVAGCERVAHIPIASDSLNAAMAATIALYEMTRVWAS
ncbi:MAG TPA: RNA methyltransferase [Solirubrobacteraceae bacterium]|nr:RNA methyltransferase [Solirubrobacteraceae bacterium]